MTRYYAEMKKGRKKIYGEACTLALVQDWVKQQEACGFVLIGEIERI